MRAITAPTVAGHPIFLRPLDPSDAEAWFEFVGDQQIMQHTSSNLRTVEDARLIIERANSAEPGTPIQFAVCTRRPADR